MLRVRFAFMFVLFSACGFPTFAASVGFGPGGDTGTACLPGSYLPKNQESCKKCLSVGHVYCPGGEFKKSTSEDQGIFECPANTRSNSDRSACILSVSKVSMKYGPNGEKTKFKDQCWPKKNTKEYAECVFAKLPKRPIKVYHALNDVATGTATPTQPALD